MQYKGRVQALVVLNPAGPDRDKREGGIRAEQGNRLAALAVGCPGGTARVSRYLQVLLDAGTPGRSTLPAQAGH